MVRVEFQPEGKEHTITVTAESLSRAHELAEDVNEGPVAPVFPLEPTFFAGDVDAEIQFRD